LIRLFAVHIYSFSRIQLFYFYMSSVEELRALCKFLHV
jgi:hypothetical protein